MDARGMVVIITPWLVWQTQVLAAVRVALAGLVEPPELTDIDWNAWRPLYEQGHSPQAAVERALERDL